MTVTLPASSMNPSLPPAIVVGLDCVTGLQTARILASHRIPVIGVAADPTHFSCRTRSCIRVEHAPSLNRPLVEAVRTIGESISGSSVVFACTDESVRQISAERALLPGRVHVPLPAHDIVMRLMDKEGFASLAREAGIPIPRTVVLRDEDGVRAASRLTFPLVIKPGLKTREWLDHAPAKVLMARTPAELDAIVTEFGPWATGLIAQEWIVGADDSLFSCNAYFDRDGQPATTFVARKLRQWPPGAGTSSLGEEIRNDEVREMTLRLFGAAGFHGLAYLEVKRDARTGRHYAIEPNVGRPTGRSAIAELGGVPLLLTAYRDALGIPLPDRREQRYGSAKWIYLRHDLQSAFVLWRRGALTPRAWLRSLRGVRSDAVFSVRDPMPFIHDVAQTVARRVRQRLGARSRIGAVPARSWTAGQGPGT
jgi:predicted ATP-grasp superfamily ATP-dependent carboligase